FSVETFVWAASDAISPNANATLTNTAFTVNNVPATYMYSLSGVVTVPSLTGASGNNTIDASAWTGSGIIISGLAGDDTLRGGSGADTLRGDGFNLGASTGNDMLFGGPGADTLNGDDQVQGGTG